MSQKESVSRGSARMRLYIAIGLAILATIYITARLTMDPAPPVPPPGLDGPAPGGAPGIGSPPGLAGPGAGQPPGLAPGLNGPGQGTPPGLNPNP